MIFHQKLTIRKVSQTLYSKLSAFKKEMTNLYAQTTAQKIMMMMIAFRKSARSIPMVKIVRRTICVMRWDLCLVV